jgi:hypothetical protein
LDKKLFLQNNPNGIKNRKELREWSKTKLGWSLAGPASFATLFRKVGISNNIPEKTFPVWQGQIVYKS